MPLARMNKTAYAINSVLRRRPWHIVDSHPVMFNRVRGQRIRPFRPHRVVRVKRTNHNAPPPPAVPKIPPVVPAIAPKPLKSVAQVPGGPASSAGSRAAIANVAPPPPYAWLLQNGPILLLNFGSLCTLAGFTRHDVLELRTLTMTGNLCACFYFFTRSPAAWAPMAWSSVFGLTNAVNIYRILDERSDRVVLSRHEQAVYEEHFLPHGLTPKQFSRLMGRSREATVPKGEVIVRKGEPLRSVYLVCKGRTRASVLGRRLTYASSEPGNCAAKQGGDSGAWIGEIAFLESFWRKESPKRARTRPAAAMALLATKCGTERGQAGVSTGGGAGREDDNMPQQSSESDGQEVEVVARMAGSGRALHTVVAVDDCLLQLWSHEDLEDIMKSSSDMRAAMTRSMTAAIVGKVVNFTVSKYAETPTWSTWLKDWKLSGGARVTITREDGTGKESIMHH